MPSPRKGGDIRGRTRYRGLAIRKVGEVVGSERMLGREVTGTKRRARVPIRRRSLITRGDERTDLSNGGRRKQRRRQRIRLTENTLLKETDHGDEGFSGVDINKEDEKDKAEIYVGQGSKVHENKEVGISNTNLTEIKTDRSTKANAKNATIKSMMELLDKTDDDMTFTTLENFDKRTIKELLEKKEKKVGDVVLVDGKPAVIRKRILGRVKDVKINTKKKINIQNPD